MGSRMLLVRGGLAAFASCLAVAGCGGGSPEPAPAALAGAADVSTGSGVDRAEPSPPPEPTRHDTASVDEAATPAGDAAAQPDQAEADATTATARPNWLGTRVLPLRPDGYGEIQPTPDELQDRRLPPPPLLPEPEDETFAASITSVPDDVLGRSTWSPGCPVGLDELRYVTVTYWGFDERVHTGELLVHADAADDLVGVFAHLHEAAFPIEEMRVVAPEELDAPPTGDGNNTTAFVCRPSRGQTAWSQHAYGLAVDINPFHNPYLKGDVVLPELATAYTDRAWDRPGMIQPSDVVTSAFAEIGWGWGGNWRSLADWMHFSRNGR